MPTHFTLPPDGTLEIRFESDAGYIILADVERNFALQPAERSGYDKILDGILRGMNEEAFVAWGCPVADFLFRLHHHSHFDPFACMEGYAAGFRAQLETSGDLCLSYYTILFNEDASRFDGRDYGALKRISVRPGRYVVTVLRHFGWLEGEQEAPFLNQGVNYTIHLAELPSVPQQPQRQIRWAF